MNELANVSFFDSINVVELAIYYGIQVLKAIVLITFGWLAINYLSKILKTFLEKQSLDLSLQKFLRQLIVIALRVILIVSVAGIVGIQTTSIVAILGAISLAIGLALQGTLQNFAGGVIILFLKPFKTGDFIDSNGSLGTVLSISLFYTHLRTPDNRIILIPNSNLANSRLTNFTKEPTRRAELTIGISYGDDVKSARNLIFSIMADDPRILQDPAPVVVLSELGDNSVDLIIRFWVNQQDFLAAQFDTREKIYELFPQNNLNFPFPQLDVHFDKRFYLERVKSPNGSN
jgi:small conductance mechanosensitive channel